MKNDFASLIKLIIEAEFFVWIEVIDINLVFTKMFKKEVMYY